MVLDINKVMLAAAEKKMNWTEIREHTGIATVTIVRIQRGRPILMKTAGKLAEALGVRVADLLKS